MNFRNFFIKEREREKMELCVMLLSGRAEVLNSLELLIILLIVFKKKVEIVEREK